MGKNFWPIYIIVAAVLLAATWQFSPMVGEKLPPSARESIRGLVRTCLGHDTAASSAAAVPAAPAAERPNAIRPLAPAAQPAAQKPVAAQPAAARPAATVVPKPAAVSAAEEDELPSLKGVMQADAATATWGVLNQVTTVEGLDGEEKGSVAGGRIFLIDSRESTKKGMWLIGNFSPTPMPEPVRVPAMNLYCFTGKPESLSQNQRNCLRMYYQLRGEALVRKNEVLRQNAARSPYGKDAAAAQKAFAAKAKQVEESSTGDNPAAKNELSQLREKYTALLEKHRAWKKQHEAELPDPDKDPAYLEKLQKARAYATPIAGMAF